MKLLMKDWGGGDICCCSMPRQHLSHSYTKLFIFRRTLGAPRSKPRLVESTNAASVLCHERYFWSTSLPQASARWVPSTFSSHCPLSSKHPRWLTSATSTYFPLNFFWNAGNWTQGSKYANQCAKQPPSIKNITSKIFHYQKESFKCIIWEIKLTCFVA